MIFVRLPNFMAKLLPYLVLYMPNLYDIWSVWEQSNVLTWKYITDHDVLKWPGIDWDRIMSLKIRSYRIENFCWKWPFRWSGCPLADPQHGPTEFGSPRRQIKYFKLGIWYSSISLLGTRGPWTRALFSNFRFVLFGILWCFRLLWSRTPDHHCICYSNPIRSLQPTWLWQS